jgi:hypothetical protein
MLLLLYNFLDSHGIRCLRVNRAVISVSIAEKMLHWLLYAATLLALAILVLYRLYVSPLYQVPAIHPLASFTSLYMLWIRYKDRENDEVYLAHQRLGPVIRLGPKELSINCIDDGIRTVYLKPSFKKTSYYSFFLNYK